MSIIGVPNLKEIATLEGFLCDLNIFLILCKEEKCEEN